MIVLDHLQVTEDRDHKNAAINMADQKVILAYTKDQNFLIDKIHPLPS